MTRMPGAHATSAMLELCRRIDTTHRIVNRIRMAARPSSNKWYLSGPEPRCEIVDERLFVGVADRGAPPHHLFNRSRPARGGEPLLFNDIGLMAGQAYPLVGGGANFGGNMRRHGLWREMLRKVRLEDGALLGRD